jgi:copper chaperone CopZ
MTSAPLAHQTAVRAPKQVVLKVEMACSGCSGAVERVLAKLAGARRARARRTAPLAGGLQRSPAAVINGFCTQRGACGHPG